MTSSVGTAVSADGIPVCYEVRGGGAPALVFVHGWSCDRRYWNAQVDYFADRHQVVAIDLAGHGESGLGRTAWTMPCFGADVVAVVKQLGLRAPPEVALDAIKYAVANEPAAVAGLRDATVPVVAINPDDRPSDVESFERHGVKVVLMSGVGHFLMMEDPVSFNRTLGETIERLEADQRRS